MGNKRQTPPLAGGGTATITASQADINSLLALVHLQTTDPANVPFYSRIVAGTRARTTTKMRTFLYRVLENDDDGDPLDFGVVNAVDLASAKTLVRAHLQELGTFGWDGGTLPVRFYDCGDATLTEGIPSSDGHVDVRLKGKASK